MLDIVPDLVPAAVVLFVVLGSWLWMVRDPVLPPSSGKNRTAIRTGLAVIAVSCLLTQARVRSGATVTVDVALRLGFALAIFLWVAYESALAVQSSFGRSQEEPRPAVYSVPRRFSLGTLIAVMVAFSLLSTVFRWVLGESLVILLVLGFVAVVGLAQFAFEAAPRQGSMLAGVLFFALPVGLYSMSHTPLWHPYWFVEAMYYAAWWAIGGAFVGYATGIIVGSLFMLLAGGTTLFRSHE